MKTIKKILGAILIIIFCLPGLALMGALILISDVLSVAYNWWNPDSTWTSAGEADEQKEFNNIFDDFE